LAHRKLSREQLEQLYATHGGALLAYACSLTLDRGQGEDVLHQVFARMLRGDIDLPEVPLAYLYSAVRNAAFNLRRNGARQTALEAASSFVHRSGDRDAELALQAALQQLPEEQRAVVIMRIWSGMTLEEIAQGTGEPLSTIASRYRYALTKLRERLKYGRQT
jgi:RNA polymerase sigma-70 factor, ECF subfamily